MDAITSGNIAGLSIDIANPSPNALRLLVDYGMDHIPPEIGLHHQRFEYMFKFVTESIVYTGDVEHLRNDQATNMPNIQVPMVHALHYLTTGTPSYLFACTDSDEFYSHARAQRYLRLPSDWNMIGRQPLNPHLETIYLYVHAKKHAAMMLLQELTLTHDGSHMAVIAALEEAGIMRCDSQGLHIMAGYEALSPYIELMDVMD